MFELEMNVGEYTIQICKKNLFVYQPGFLPVKFFNFTVFPYQPYFKSINFDEYRLHL